MCSNGIVIQNVNKTKVVKGAEKRLRRLQRKAFRKYDRNKEESRFVKTSNIVKVEKQIRLLHKETNEYPTHHIHQSKSAIVKTNSSTIVMESLNSTVHLAKLAS